MDDAEVKVKMGMDSMELRAGAASAKESLKNFAESSESKMHSLRRSIREVKHILEGFGIVLVIDKAIELYHVLTEFWIPFITGAEKSEENQKRWGESLKRSREELRKLDEERAKGAKLREDMELDNASPEEKVKIYTRDLAQLQAQRSKFMKDHAEDAYAWTKVAGKAMADTEKQAKFAVEKEKIDNAILATQREVAKAEKEASDAAFKAATDQSDAAQKAWDDKVKAADKAHEKQEKMNAAVANELAMREEILSKINDAAVNKFMPSEGDIRKDGFTDRGGRFHPSYAARLQNDIDAETKAFERNRLNGVFSGDQKGAEKEVNHIEEMKKNLDNYLGGTSKTTAEKIAEATAKSEKHLEGIAEEFKK